MTNDYFKRVSALTPTKFWINNVTQEKARLAIRHGAVGCTQNPSYTWKMLAHPSESNHARRLLKETKLNQPVVSRFNNPVPDLFIDELLQKVTEFCRAYKINGLTVHDYEEFGPVEYFRQMFVDAWESALKVIETTRRI